MAESVENPRTVERSASWWMLVLGVALGLRVVGAVLVTWYVQGKGKLCVFSDTKIYRDLARTIVDGTPYVVSQWGSPHYAMRTPGYPLFLAGCWEIFGPNLLAVRLVQAVLGTFGVWLVAKLAAELVPDDSPGGRGIPILAASLAAVHPYIVGMSALVLSEATFEPLLLLGLWGLARLWRKPGESIGRWGMVVAIGTGLAMGGAILSRPSWALFVPGVLAVWVLGAGREARGTAFRRSMVVALATAAILAPWWVRNARVIGRFVPTALWVGASLYDGVGPQADGSSEMGFVEEPGVRSLGEVEQDAVFRERSWEQIQSHPGRVLKLAMVKFGRFWSPWPNADTLQAPGVSAVSGLVTIPVFGLIALGLWSRRRDLRALTLLAGPLAYFCVLHMVFVSSIRYRIPGEVPAMGLAAVGLARALGLGSNRNLPRNPEQGRARLMSVRRRFRKLLGWGALLVVTVLVGGAIAAYHYVTDSETLANLIRREAPRFLPGCRVDVLSRVKLRVVAGDATISQLVVRERVDDSTGPMVAIASKIHVKFNAWAMTKGRFEPQEVTVAKPTLRLRRKADGSWNLQGLIADPWPIPSGGPTPLIVIQEGTIELAEDDSKGPLTLLRDVSIKIPPCPGQGAPLEFEMSAKGDPMFDRVHAEGTIDPSTGRVSLKGGELFRLSLSETLREKLPVQVQEALGKAGLEGGEVDASLLGLTFDPNSTPKVHYRATARLRHGLWKCPKLPFPISDIAVDLEARDGELAITRGDGSDGSTDFHLQGKATLALDDLMHSPFEVQAEARNLELDLRLRRWIPEDKRELWDAYFPQVTRIPSSSAGRVSIKAVVGRPTREAKIGVEADLFDLDVSMEYKHFAYPVEHVRGKIHYTPERMTLDVNTLVGNKPVVMTGTIDKPGPDAVARLGIDIESLPLDATLDKALPPEVYKAYATFKPTGSVKGHAELVRKPPLTKQDDPRGRVEFDAWVKLNPGCSATWDGLRYPIMNLSGKLEIHPNRWIFPEMKGNNGQASIIVSGEVNQIRRNTFKVDVQVKAWNLPFDDQLRDSLPTPWRVTWGTLNPTGASDIDATIHVDPTLPLARDRDHYHVVIVPRKSTTVKLRFNPLVGEGAPAGPIEMRMDDVSGRFVYDTATSPPTTMTDVKFSFQRAPVTFTRGTVDVKDNGEFRLGVSHLEVANLRLDEELRRYMPPVMGQFSRRLVDWKVDKIQTNLGLGWSGKVGESAWCRWDQARVILIDKKISLGSDLALDHINGELNEVQGSFLKGRELNVRGKLLLDSFSVFGQQLSGVTGDIEVEPGLARLDQIKGKILGGKLNGRLTSTLESTPRYSVAVSADQADLQAYAMTQSGHQGFRGLVTAWVELSGIGSDPHSISGAGSAKIVQGDLGTLPVALRFFNVLKLAKDAKTAFDSAEVGFKVKDGETVLDPVRFAGNAFSLDGKGTLDVRGDLDLKLKPSPGRDGWRIPLLTDFARELGGQILVVRIQGPAASPSFRPEVIPLPGETLRAYKRNRDIRRTGLIGPWRDRDVKKTGLLAPWQTGLEPRLKSSIASRWFGPED